MLQIYTGQQTLRGSECMCPWVGEWEMKISRSMPALPALTEYKTNTYHQHNSPTSQPTNQPLQRGLSEPQCSIIYLSQTESATGDTPCEVSGRTINTYLYNPIWAGDENYRTLPRRSMVIMVRSSSLPSLIHHHHHQQQQQQQQQQHPE
jgi:hypothetical protein